MGTTAVVSETAGSGGIDRGDSVAAPAAPSALDAPSALAAPAIPPERVRLGRELAARAPHIGETCNLHLRAIMKLGPDDPLPIVHASPTSTMAATILARWLETGEAATTEEAAVLARPGSLALGGDTSMTTLVKLFLVWRDVTVAELREIGAELHTPPDLLRLAMDAARVSCDASLVRMTKRFDERKLQLEALLAEERGRLLHEATHDQLTGLANRKAFLEMVRQAGEGLAAGESFAVMFLDLDDFKEVNDTHGHVFGDVFLQVVAARLAEVLRPHDTAARIGGDEFVVLCRHLRGGPATAHGIAKRLCEQLRTDVSVDGVTVRCSASIGLAFADGPSDPAELMARADRALYDAKRGGKARVAIV